MILKKQVTDILRDVPESRNSDITLMIEIWKKFFPQFIKKGASGEHGIWLQDLYKLPREDNVKRLRAHTQNVEGKYLPTLWSVAKQRKIKEVEWKDYMGKLKNTQELW